LAAENRRIDSTARACGETYGEIKCRAISEGWDEPRTELEILRASRPKAPAPHTANDGVRSAQAIEAALCISAGLSEERVGQWYDAPTMEAALSRDLCGAGIHTLFYEVIRASGGHVRPGRVDNDTIRAAVVANGGLIHA